MFTISVSGMDGVNKAVGTFTQKISPSNVMRIAAAAGVATWKDHFRSHYTWRKNALGGASTGYWRTAHDSVISTVAGNKITLSATGKGLRMKYLGGVVRPTGKVSEVTGKPIKMLSVPVHPRAHGKSIADLGGKAGFYIVPFFGGGFGGGAGAAGVFYRGGRGKGRRASDPLYYVLKKSVSIKADKNLIPSLGTVLANIQSRLNTRAATP